MHLLDPLAPDLPQVPTRDGFGKTVVELAEKDLNVVGLTADVAESVRMHWFAEKFPDRFFQCGVAEQNMAGVAAGLAYAGKMPFIAAYGVFSPGRNWDQIRVALCYGDANVKIEGSHTGLTVGPDGATHQALEDIAIMRVLPHMTVFAPCDAMEARKATIAAAKINGPVYIRCSRDKAPQFTTEKTPFEPGKAAMLKDGKDCAVVACGAMVHESLLAAAELEKNGVDAAVVNMHTLSDVDGKTLEEIARKTGRIITVEEHQIVGGLGSAVCEALSEKYPVPVKRIGMKMEFGESGTAKELLEKYGMNAKNIAKVCREMISAKR